MCPYKNLYAIIYCDFLHIHEKLETVHMLMNPRINKTVIYPYNEILLSNKKEQTTETFDTQKATYFMIPLYVRVWKRQS